MDIKPGAARISANFLTEYVKHFGEGLVATNGVRYTSVVTFGTTATEIFNELVNPGAPLSLTELLVALTQRFDNLITSSVGSLFYFLEAREEWADPTGTLRTGSWVNISGTYTKGIPTSGVSGDPSEDTLTGYVPVATLPHAPVRVRLTARGLVASSMTGEVKNSSSVELRGIVIPGTK